MLQLMLQLEIVELFFFRSEEVRNYKSLGGEFFDEWRQVLLEADALNRLADE